MSILRQIGGITSTARHLERLAAGVLLLALSTTASADWRTDARDTLVDEAGARRLVVLGEMHGTREIPVLAGDLVEYWSRTTPVLLALEIPVTEHAALREAVTGGGTDAAIDSLRTRPWWRVAPVDNDGRRSEDVLSLVQRIGRLQSKRDVAILPFDPRDIRCFERGNCEAAMASVLQRAHDALPRGRIVAVTGNVHAMRLRPGNAPAAFPQMPMTARLRDLAPLSVDISAARGEFWRCGEDDCGPVSVGPSRGSGRQPPDAPFDYRMVLPVFTPIRQVGDRDR